MMDAPPHVLEAFRRIVASGESPRLAEMLAYRRAPQPNTDGVHFEGMGMAHLEKTLGKPWVDNLTKQARKAGIAINDSSIYNGSLADARAGGDPGAWLLTGDGKDQLKKRARERGLACETLGVEHGESQQRMEFIQPKIEKQRAKNQQFRVMKDQLQKDIKAGHEPKSIKQKV
jgi:hypothetical protein